MDWIRNGLCWRAPVLAADRAEAEADLLLGIAGELHFQRFGDVDPIRDDGPLDLPPPCAEPTGVFLREAPAFGMQREAGLMVHVEPVVAILWAADDP